MNSLLKLTVVVIFLGVVAFISFNFIQGKLNPRIGQLSVNVSNQKAKVFLDDSLIGTTPLYAKNLPLGDHRIRIESEKNTSKSFSWQTSTTLTKSTISTIDLDLAPSQNFSAGESLYFQPGNKTVSILSRPDNAVVLIDQKERGKTPLTLTLEKGVHQLLLKKEGFLDREVPINMEEGYKLSAVVYLARNPFEKVTKIDSNNKISLFILNSLYNNLAKDSSDWVEGIDFIQQSFNSSQTKFDVLIDSSGKSYILNKTEWENKKQSKSVSTVGYLARASETKLTEAANSTWQKLKEEFN